MKAVWKSTTVVSGRLSVMTPGTSEKQRWSVSSWAMDMPYWQYRVLPLARDQVGSATQFGGQLEVYFNNSSDWETVCNDSWGLLDATVACKQMGFVGVSVSDSSRFGSGASTQNILLDDVACRGSESQLIDCSYDGNTADCSHSEDVGIVCILQW